MPNIEKRVMDRRKEVLLLQARRNRDTEAREVKSGGNAVYFHPGGGREASLRKAG